MARYFRRRNRLFNSRFRSRTWLGTGLALVLIAAACGDDEPAPTAAPVTTAAPAPTTTAVPAPAGDSTGVTADQIKLGTFGDVSGPVAIVGQPMRSAHDIVVSKWSMKRAESTVGQIVLVHEDDQYDPARTIGAVRKLLEQDEVFPDLRQHRHPSMRGGHGDSA